MREDLRLMEYAEDFGYTAEPRSRAGKASPDNGYAFRRGDVSVWEIRDGWQVAKLVDGMYTNHQPQPDLKTALRVGLTL